MTTVLLKDYSIAIHRYLREMLVRVVKALLLRQVKSLSVKQIRMVDLW